MTFYEALFPIYDRIFPLNKQTESFLTKHFGIGESILDVGAGTGSLAVALAEKGYDITALEPDRLMANNIMEKASSLKVSINVQTLSMEQIEELEGTYDGIYCVGNTLPHLQTVTEIELFLHGCFQKLTAGGYLVLQTVNFDKFLSTNNYPFPIIAQKDFTFERKYEWSGDKILFTAVLTSEEEKKTNSITLFPLHSKQLITILEKRGFECIQLYGDLMCTQHSVDSPAIVVIAHKRKGPIEGQ